MTNLVPDLRIGDRPEVQEISLGGKKTSQSQPPRNMTGPGVQPEIPSSIAPVPIAGGVRPAGAIGTGGSSAVAPTFKGQSPSQQWMSQPRGSVFAQPAAALQGSRQFKAIASKAV